MNNELKLKRYTEFETKYRTELARLFDFKKSMESVDEHSFAYVQGPDHYFTAIGRPFIRLRVGQYEDSTGKRFMQLTSKSKPDEAKNNIKRREPNLTITGNTQEEAREFLDMIGYSHSFSIWKGCHIYTFHDATVVFYTVIDDMSTENHFVEIEVKEENIDTLTEQEAYKVIEKYEGILQNMGITAKRRLKLSLFDMYRKDKV